MSKTFQIPHPFKGSTHVPGAPMLKGPAPGKSHHKLLEALAEHVVGHRVTSIEFTRDTDEASSKELGFDVDCIDLTLTLDNNVAYCARFVVASIAVVSRGEALAHIREDEEHYVDQATKQ